MTAAPVEIAQNGIELFLFEPLGQDALFLDHGAKLSRGDDDVDILSVPCGTHGVSPASYFLAGQGIIETPHILSAGLPNFWA